MSSHMKITSPAFNHGQFIPPKYTCDGEDVVNPPFAFSKIPKNAKSLVLMIDSPQVPSRDWIHWLLWNIPADTKGIAEGSVPKGARVAKNDFHHPDYHGPCPPVGAVHQYQFKLYALDAKLKLAHDAKKEEIERAMHGHVIEHAILVGLYKRK